MTRRGSSVSLALASAATALLPATHSIAAEPWQIDAELLYYSESGGRVSDNSFKSIAQRSWKDEGNLVFGLQLDSLTGASPSGAIALDEVQSITQPSGNNSVVTQPGELPLDDSFKDTRLALTASLSNVLETGARYSAGTSLSKEYDYLHLGGNASYAKDYNNSNTTLSAGFAIAQDTVEPVGGAPIPLSFQRAEGAVSDRAKNKSKTVVDALFGLTQIINRRSLFQLNYSLSLADGYLTDPYKVLTVLDDVGNPVDSIQDDIYQYRYESRPNSRLGHNLYLEYKHRFDAAVYSASYRYHTDDWGVDSHTIESRYRWLLSSKHYLEPNIRYYSQSSADFYRAYLPEGEIPENASSDYRLGEFTGLTLGVSYNRTLGVGKSIGASIETYETSGASTEIPDENEQTRLAPYPNLRATIVRFRYSFDW
ncbi:MAG: DUF3570 domain-containing protein [Gammaproteobacteria bacterium]|nr:DUF3570 domain-containing protein [Gammaproteobacteria bacterium]